MEVFEKDHTKWHNIRLMMEAAMLVNLEYLYKKQSTFDGVTFEASAGADQSFFRVSHDGKSCVIIFISNIFHCDCKTLCRFVDILI